MISVRSHRILTIVIMLALAAVTSMPAYAQATTVSETVVEPFEAMVPACNGEAVFVSGGLHVTTRTTVDDRGGIHVRFTLVPDSVRGVGSDTGIQYLLVGGHRSTFNGDADSAPFIFMNTEMFNLVSQGGTENLQGTINTHVTVNANGVPTVAVDSLSLQCIG
jgi:hypothetical protein